MSNEHRQQQQQNSAELQSILSYDTRTGHLTKCNGVTEALNYFLPLTHKLQITSQLRRMLIPSCVNANLIKLTSLHTLISICCLKFRFQFPLKHWAVHLLASIFDSSLL